jgi:hypothetical protein
VIKKISFAGQREDRNNVDRLRLQTNALNFNNQRNISKSIDNLSKDSSTKNINFLMNVAEQIKYGLNAGITDVKPNNDWKEQLRTATEKSISNNNTDAKESLKARFKQVFENNKDLTEQEKQVLSLRQDLLNTSGLQNEIKTSENENVQNIEKNLNYFVVSSEIATEEKVQVLEKLNKFMSPEYKIEEQLKDKKPQVLGEILNDIIVKRADQERPTIKQVDQRHHGMCAAISSARKTMAYEWKPQYIDIIMGELSDSKEMEVYDISDLGSGKKVSVAKTFIDYPYAEEKGYRIIDASTLQWMNIANNSGNGNVQSKEFSAFDRKYFDTFHDGHYNRNFEDPNLADINNQYRATNKAFEAVDKNLKTFKTRKAQALEQKMTERANAEHVAYSNRVLADNLKALMPQADDKTIHTTVNELIRLNTEKYKDAKSPFYIVDAEEDITKKEKIAKFIESKNPSVNKEELNSRMDTIFGLYTESTETLAYMNKEIEPKTQKSIMKKYYMPLYESAATYRTALDKSLDIKSKLEYTAMRIGLPETASMDEVVDALIKPFDEELNQPSVLQQQAIALGMPDTSTVEEVLNKLAEGLEKTLEKPELFVRQRDALGLPETATKEEVIQIALSAVLQNITAPSPVAEKAMELGLPETATKEEVLETIKKGFVEELSAPTVREYHAERLGLPADATKEQILKEMENKGEVVSESILRSLQDRYNKIAKYDAVVEKAEVKGDKVSVKGLYDISKTEANALENVKSRLKTMKQEMEGDKKYLEKVLDAPLNAQAKQLALETGMYWVGEGSSGLFTAQEVRILEQMTGQRFYAEESVDNAVNIIKTASHSGISGTQVYHNDHGGHAMYIADVAPVQVKNPETGKFETKDAIMHDNSWGYAEKKNNWIDSNGLERTDYACGRGGDTGYITNSLWQNGTIAEDFKNKIGVIKSKKLGGEDYKFRMFSDAIIPSRQTHALSSAQNIVETLFGYSHSFAEGVKIIEDAIDNGSFTEQDLKMMQLKSAATGNVYKAAEKNNLETWNNVKSEEDWNKIDVSNPAKFLMEKVAFALALDSETLVNYASKLKTPEDLKKANKQIEAVAVKEFVQTIREAAITDYDFNAYQVDAKEYGKNRIQLVKEWIDKTYNPADNVEFITALYKLKAMSKKDLTDFVKANTTKDDLGINRKTSYQILKQYQNLDPKTEDYVSHLLNLDVLDSLIGLTKEGFSPNEQYFVLRRNFENYLDYDQKLKPYMAKNIAMGYRAGHPNYSLFDEEVTREAAQAVLTNMIQSVESIKTASNDEERKINVKLLKKSMESHVNTEIDKVHRNRVLNTLSSFVSEYYRNPESAKLDKLAEQYQNEMIKYSIMKKPVEIFDEYLMLKATKQDPERAELLKKYIDLAGAKTGASKLSFEVMNAAQQGHAHEVGKELENVELKTYKVTINGKKVGQEKVKLGKDLDAALVQMHDEALSMTDDFVATATIFNTLALSGKLMKALDRAIDFKNIILQIKSPENRAELINFLRSEMEFVKNLRLDKYVGAEALRQKFFAKCEVAFRIAQKSAQQAVKQM